MYIYIYLQKVVVNLQLHKYNNTTMTMKRKVPENGGLEGIEDNNGGIYVEMTQPMDSIAFLTMLRASITQWKEQVVFILFFFSLSH